MDNERVVKAFDDLLEATDCQVSFSKAFQYLPEDAQQKLLPEITKIFSKYMTAASTEVSAVIAKILK